jgi:phosphatidylglycerophosphate synthase
MMCISIFFELYYIALLFLIINRLGDGLDGAMARLTSPTPLGGYLDIVFDFLIYSGFLLAFGLNNNDHLTSALILLFCYIGTGTTYLANSALSNRLNLPNNKLGFKNKMINKNIKYAYGLVEGFETIVFMILCLLAPNLFNLLSVIFIILCLCTFITRIYVSYKAF